MTSYWGETITREANLITTGRTKYQEDIRDLRTDNPRFSNMTGIFRQLEKLNTPLAGKWRAAALSISFCSIIVNISLGVIYFVLSYLAWSPAAFGFALEVILDCASSVLVVWRFIGAAGHLYSYEKERKACLGIAVCFILSALGILGKAIHTLVIDKEPKKNESLLILTAASFVALFIMAHIKYLVAYKTDSMTLRTDAFNTTAGGIMAFAMLLASLLYEKSSAIWFLDATVAICIALVFLAYGTRMIIELSKNKGTPIPNE
ncbi:transmembrane protein 163-like [Actinia tenebrosa]|uniref:Transmembrane protein 163-like n=1 Tax=Actinia tenebrosa TaxID=6105 RepID=A0A6P8H5F3_ACTTE|nr:transmembrane protein 163-like [Actinia tenebrosa]